MCKSWKQNYPNPFNATTTIEFTLARDCQVSLTVFDALGREVAMPVKNELKAGILYRVPFNASNLASGIYFYKLETGENVQVRQFTLIK
jgi:hypothetical protein